MARLVIVMREEEDSIIVVGARSGRRTKITMPAGLGVPGKDDGRGLVHVEDNAPAEPSLMINIFADNLRIDGVQSIRID